MFESVHAFGEGKGRIGRALIGAILEAERIIHEITGRKRNRVWAATDLMGELTALDGRIAAGMRQR